MEAGWKKDSGREIKGNRKSHCEVDCERNIIGMCDVVNERRLLWIGRRERTEAR